MTLPADFRWDACLGRPTLYLNRQPLADYQAYRDEWFVHIGLHRMAHAMRIVRLGSQADAVSYLERWATRWGDSIREEVGPRIPDSNLPELVRPPVIAPTAAVPLRKRRRPRRSPLG